MQHSVPMTITGYTWNSSVCVWGGGVGLLSVQMHFKEQTAMFRMFVVIQNIYEDHCVFVSRMNVTQVHIYVCMAECVHKYIYMYVWRNVYEVKKMMVVIFLYILLMACAML